MRITEQEILDAIATASIGEADARTASEMATASGLTIKRVREALRLIAAEGRLAVHAVPRMALDGRMVKVPAYTVAKRKATKK